MVEVAVVSAALQPVLLVLFGSKTTYLQIRFQTATIDTVLLYSSTARKTEDFRTGDHQAQNAVFCCVVYR